MLLTSDDCVRGFDVRLDDSCIPAADEVAGYLTPDDEEGDEGATGGVELPVATENSSSMRSKSNLKSLNSRLLVVQTFL